MSFVHVPVLLNETIEGLNIKPDGTYVDLTVGRAGHSSEILKRIPQGKLICFDQDEEALENSRERLGLISPNFELIKSNFEHVSEILNGRGIHQVDGILADLGVSSPQLDNPLTAARVCNEYPFEELVRILRLYGEDPDAYKIAKAIVRRRDQMPLRTTLDLAMCVKEAKSQKALSKKGHPAKQTFQAIRIEVNHEEAALERMLLEAPNLLKSGGRLAIITFMSLDDRLVKDRFRQLSTVEGSRHGPALMPSEIEKPGFQLVNRKPIVPSAKELDENHRSASAKLRILQRI